MTCPTIDKLSRYVDNLLTEQELVEIRKHMESCEECQQIIDVFKGEEQFIKETLETPVLPDEFTENVLNQLAPYKPKKKRRNPWKRVMLAAAGMTLAVGLSAALNPSFAAWVGGLFTTEKVDEGLRMATDAGLAERVNLEVTDNGLTFKIEDIIADSSRVVLSHQILNENGKVKKIYQGIENLDEILVTDQSGKLLDDVGITWSSFDDYGLLELSLRSQTELERIVIHFNLTEINGVKGNWTLDVPVELKESNDLTTTFSLDHAETSVNGVDVQLKEVQFAQSSSELFYETGFSEKEQKNVEEYIQIIEEKYRQEIGTDFMFGSEIKYHIENKEKEVIFQNNPFFDTGEDSDYEGFSRSSGKALEPIGRVARIQSFNPQKEDAQLTFVLDGIIKTVPADFSVTVKPKELKKQPVSFEYEGNSMKIKSIEKQSDYYLRKSLLPIGKTTYFMIEMEGEKETLSPELGTWVLVDDEGNSHIVYSSGSPLDRTLIVYGLDKMPEEFTLHLLSVTRYEEVEEKWEVPLQ